MTTPDDKPLDEALARMCQPLSESRLSGVTAQQDARCMQVIRDAITALRERIAVLEKDAQAMAGSTRT